MRSNYIPKTGNLTDLIIDVDDVPVSSLFLLPKTMGTSSNSTPSSEEGSGTECKDTTSEAQ